MTSYPKTVSLKDRSRVSIRPLESSDHNAFLVLCRNLPIEDRLFLRRDVSNPQIVHEMIEEALRENEVWLVAELGSEIIGQGSISKIPYGWMRHVGELRLVVTREHQRQGLATALARELFICAIGLKIEKIVAKMASEQTATIQCLEKLGFKEELTLKQYIKDMNGIYHDMVIMSQEI